jgi:predicted TIM-barrel enzyme
MTKDQLRTRLRKFADEHIKSGPNVANTSIEDFLRDTLTESPKGRTANN